MAGYTGDSRGAFEDASKAAAQGGLEGADLAYKNKVAKIEAWVAYLDAAERRQAGGGREQPDIDYIPLLSELNNPVDFSKYKNQAKLSPQLKKSIQSYADYNKTMALAGVDKDLINYINTAARVFATPGGREAVKFKGFNTDPNLSRKVQEIYANYASGNPQYGKSYFNANMLAISKGKDLLNNLAEIPPAEMFSSDNQKVFQDYGAYIPPLSNDVDKKTGMSEKTKAFRMWNPSYVPLTQKKGALSGVADAVAGVPDAVIGFYKNAPASKSTIVWEGVPEKYKLSLSPEEIQDFNTKNSGKYVIDQRTDAPQPYLRLRPLGPDTDNSLDSWYQEHIKVKAREKAQEIIKQREAEEQKKATETNQDQGFLKRNITTAMAPTVAQPTEKDIYKEALQGFLNQG